MVIGEKLWKSEVFLSGINDSKGARVPKSQMKKILITFFDIKDIVHFEFIPKGQTVNHAYHVKILKWLYESVHRKGPEIWFRD
jgi:hypothetical protein